MKYGIDRKLVYIRDKKDINGWIGPSLCRGAKTYIEHRLLVCDHNAFAGNIGVSNYFNVGFCGKLYGCVVLYCGYRKVEKVSEPDGRGEMVNEAIKAFCYTVEDADKFADTTPNAKKKDKEAYLKGEKKRYHSKIALHEAIESYFGECANFSALNYFEKYRVPVFVSDHFNTDGKEAYTTILNARLADYQFYRVKDPFTAYQNLSMYLGGLASPERSIPPISDSDMLQAKGFDKKWSFRKPPVD